MTVNDGTDAPIYDDLVDQHGDVLAQARHAAEEAQRSAGLAMHGNGSTNAPPPPSNAEHEGGTPPHGNWFPHTQT